MLVAGGDAQPLPVVKLADFGVSLLLPGMLPGREPPRSSQSLGPMSADSLDGAEAEDDELDDVDPTRNLDASALDSIIPTLGGHTTLGASSLSLQGGSSLSLQGGSAQGSSRPPQRNPDRQEARTVMLGAPAPAPLPPPPSMSPPPVDPAAEPWEPPTINLRPGPGGLRPAMEEASLVGLDPPTLTLKPQPGESRPPSSVSLPGPPRMPPLQPMSLNKNGPILDSLAAEPSEMMFGPLGGSEVTQSGILIGTPMYMAPENWAHGSHHAEPSSDLFSLGVMAFELLTGQLPFLTPPIHARARDEDVQVMRLHEARAAIDPVLCELVDRCLSLDPAARPSAAEVAQKLLELGAQRPQI